MTRNLNFGWWSLLLYLTLGLALESMHGFKVGWYLDVSNEARRLQWTLAHSHGTLLALINIVFGMYAATIRAPDAKAGLATASWCLRWAAILMPAGFFLGGWFMMGPDPGFPVVLVPIGGVLLFAGVFKTARVARDATTVEPEPTTPTSSTSTATDADRGRKKKGR